MQTILAHSLLIASITRRTANHALHVKLWNVPRAPDDRADLKAPRILTQQLLYDFEAAIQCSRLRLHFCSTRCALHARVGGRGRGVATHV